MWLQFFLGVKQNLLSIPAPYRHPSLPFCGHISVIFHTKLIQKRLRPPQTRKHFCGRKCFPICARTQTKFVTFVADAKFASETQNVSEFFQKHFASATNVSPFACHGNITSNNVSSFAGAFRDCTINAKDSL